MIYLIYIYIHICAYDVIDVGVPDFSTIFFAQMKSTAQEPGS